MDVISAPWPTADGKRLTATYDHHGRPVRVQKLGRFSANPLHVVWVSAVSRLPSATYLDAPPCTPPSCSRGVTAGLTVAGVLGGFMAVPIAAIVAIIWRHTTGPDG